MNVKDTDISYLAGLIDGEGYIGVKRSGKAYGDRKTPGYHARIQIRMVDEPAIAFLTETLGGRYYMENPHAAQGRPLFCYQASDAAAERVLRTVLPYLRVKRRSAELVLAFRELQARSREYRTKIVGEKNFPNAVGTVRMVPIRVLSDEYIAMCDDFWSRAKALNHA